MPSAKKRGGLGRGLNALVSEAEYETGGSAASASNATSETKLPIEDIVPNPNQPRIHFNETELRELSESIQEHGVLQPLLVRKHGNGYEIIAGERRYQASKLAGLEELPVIIKEVNDEEMLALALIENLQRSDLNPVEEAKGYRQLIDASGMTQEALSKAVSKSRSAITNSLRLLDLPEVVQQMIFEGKLTAGHARAILAVPYEEDGKIYDRISNPDYIEWLKTFRQAYQEGLIGIDYLVDSDDQVTEKSNNGAYFCMLREWSGMQEANAILASSENPDSYYIAIDGPANSNGDAPLIFPGSLDGWMSTFISKDCKDPARAIAFLTYMLSEEGQKDIFLGIEGETYEVVDGKPQLTDEMIELMNSDPNTFATQYGLVDTYWMLRNSVIVDQWRPASPYYITAMSDWADKNAFVNGGIYNNLEPTGDSEEAIAATRINQRWQEVVPELITAASDEEFDKILSDFLAARDSYGYEKVVSYEQNLLDVRKALFQ